MPSAVRGTAFFTPAADASAGDAPGIVPATTTVTVRLSALLPAPVTDSVYVVVTRGRQRPAAARRDAAERVDVDRRGILRRPAQA